MIRFYFAFLLLACGGAQAGQSMAALTSQPTVLWSTAYGAVEGDVYLQQDVILDMDAEVDSLTIPGGVALVFDPAASHTLRVRGNVIVDGGRLEMAPAGAQVVHTVHFFDVGDESQLPAGGGMSITDHDGIWVVNGGEWVARGTPKAAWLRGSVSDQTWLSTDWLAIAPVGSAAAAPGAHNYHAQLVQQSQATYPGDDLGHQTEVANLTRNVRVLGESASRRAHTIFLGPDCARQTVEHVELQYMSPVGIEGRYGLHWHHCGDTSRGSVARGVVVRDSGDHAFVPHGSHGITIEDAVAYNMAEGAAFWWDPDSPQSYPANASHDITYRDSIVLEYKNRAFYLGQGEENRAYDLVATAGWGTGTTGGFEWPSQVNGMPNVWHTRDLVVHHVRKTCWRVWQNDQNEHLVHRLHAWRCGQGGALIGAYRNGYRYEHLSVQTDDGWGLLLHSLSHPEENARPIEIHDVEVDAAIPIKVGPHNQPQGQRMLVADVRATGATGPWVAYEENSTLPSHIDFVRVTHDGADLTTADIDTTGAHGDSTIRIEDRQGNTYVFESGQWVSGDAFAVSGGWG